MEFFKGAQNFTMGNVEFNTVQGDYHDYSVRNVRNTYGNKNRYYTNNSNSYNDNSNNFAGGYHAPSSHYHGAVNNIGSVQNANFGENHGTINQGTTTQVVGGPPPPPPAPAPAPSAGPYTQSPYGLRPGPAPNDQDFTASSTAIPQHEGFPQQRGPATPNPPRRVPSDPAMPEGNLAWQQQQRPQPSAFPPAGPQGYPQHSPQDPSFRPPQGPFPPPQQPQRAQAQQPQPQTHPFQQPAQQRQGTEQWPGQNSYRQGMEHLRQSKPSGWDTNNGGSSDSSDDDSPIGRISKKQKEARSRPVSEGPNRASNGGGGVALGASMSVGGGNVVATAAGGTRLSANYSATQATSSAAPYQNPVFNQGSQYAAPPPAARQNRPPQPEQQSPPRTDFPPPPQRDPLPQPSPQQQQRPQSTPAPAPAPASAPANPDRLAVPQNGPGLSGLAAHLAANSDPRRHSVEMEEVSDEDAPPANSSPLDKKKKKHRNPFHNMFSSKKK
ncbi:hypothetical protein MD484_g5473, partial [Candolleomyces efflorescens]